MTKEVYLVTSIGQSHLKPSFCYFPPQIQLQYFYSTISVHLAEKNIWSAQSLHIYVHKMSSAFASTRVSNSCNLNWIMLLCVLRAEYNYGFRHSDAFLFSRIHLFAIKVFRTHSFVMPTHIRGYPLPKNPVSNLINALRS